MKWTVIGMAQTRCMQPTYTRGGVIIGEPRCYGCHHISLVVYPTAKSLVHYCSWSFCRVVCMSLNGVVRMRRVRLQHIVLTVGIQSGTEPGFPTQSWSPHLLDRPLSWLASQHNIWWSDGYPKDGDLSSNMKKITHLDHYDRRKVCVREEDMLLGFIFHCS